MSNASATHNAQFINTITIKILYKLQSSQCHTRHKNHPPHIYTTLINSTPPSGKACLLLTSADVSGVEVLVKK